MATRSHTLTTIEDGPDGIRVVMPVPRIGCVAVFLSLWMCGWAMGEVSAIRSLLAGGLLNPGGLFLLVWLVGWTAGGVVAGAILFATIDGREILTIDGSVVRRRVEAFRWGLSWRYPLDKVSNFRTTGDSEGDQSFLSFDTTSLKGDKTIRMGSGLTEARAEEIAETVWARYPSLMPGRERRKREHEAAEAAVPPESPPAG